jgi:hypothetical protein
MKSNFYIEFPYQNGHGNSLTLELEFDFIKTLHNIK